MNHISTSSELKAAARDSLSGYYAFLIGILFCSSIIILLFSMLFNQPSLPPFFQYSIALLVSVFTELITFHIYRIYLLVCCHQPVSYRDLFLGNPDREKEGRTFRVAFLFAFIQWLCMLPSNIMTTLYEFQQSNLFFLFSCILLTIGLAIYYYFYLSVFPIYFLVADCPGETTMETFRMAAFITRGHRFRLFYIIISFLPLVLISLLSCGVGLLWVMPYLNATLTQYYLNLAACKSQSR